MLWSIKNKAKPYYCLSLCIKLGPILWWPVDSRNIISDVGQAIIVIDSLAGNVADMSATCRPDSQMSAFFANTSLSCSAQNWSRQNIFVLGMADIYPFLLFVLEYVRTTCQNPLLYIHSLDYNTIEQWQQQHTTTNMSHAALPSTGFSPLHPWLGQRHRQLMVPPLHIGLRKARAIKLGSATVGSLVWGANASPIKK